MMGYCNMTAHAYIKAITCKQRFWSICK